MVQVLRTMNEGRAQYGELHVTSLEDRGLMRLSTITDLGERQRRVQIYLPLIIANYPLT